MQFIKTKPKSNEAQCYGETLTQTYLEKAWQRKCKTQPNMVPKTCGTASWHCAVYSPGQGSGLLLSARQMDLLCEHGAGERWRGGSKSVRLKKKTGTSEWTWSSDWRVHAAAQKHSLTRSITEARVRANQKYGWWDIMKTSSLQESHDIGPTHDCVTSSSTPQRLF